ncbi:MULTISPECIES: WXG100 family type VII secretion target [Actinomadura]|jgi:WXG100 family type VII secretion target|uniref:WXG100 family type VII secretion target n=1 Tax=Actinomadura geliboluensis TaxID=882440 RepID=A0A5S4G3R0_9ACTN|nr:WXG100 family type VII secretion target [Actinomadura geliboluensis]TMR27021.1 WXG100 family type VII secretion target [Actinomadura geliboluensis]
MDTFGRVVATAILAPIIPIGIPLLGVIELADGDSAKLREAALKWDQAKGQLAQVITELEGELKRLPLERTWRGESYHEFNKSVTEFKQALSQLPDMYNDVKTQLNEAADTLADAWIGIIAICIAIVAFVLAALALAVPSAGSSLAGIPASMSAAVASASAIVGGLSTLFGVFGGNLKDWSGTKPFQSVKSPQAKGNVETHKVKVDLKNPGLWVDNQK